MPSQFLVYQPRTGSYKGSICKMEVGSLAWYTKYMAISSNLDKFYFATLAKLYNQFPQPLLSKYIKCNQEKLTVEIMLYNWVVKAVW